MEKIPRQWASLNKSLNTARFVNLSLLVLLLCSFAAQFFLLQMPPVVVTLQQGKKTFFWGERKNMEIDKTDIKAFLEDYIRTYYRRKGEGKYTIFDDIAPFSTKSFLEALREKMKREKRKLSKKKITQRAIDIEIHFEGKNIIAAFDKLLRIDGTPFIMATQAAFKLAKGAATRWNPMGIYVNGVIEHEKKH